MSGDPQEDFEQAWQRSGGETIAQAAVCVVVGVPLLVLFEVVQFARRLRSLFVPERQTSTPTRADIERIMEPRRRAAARRR